MHFNDVYYGPLYSIQSAALWCVNSLIRHEVGCDENNKKTG